MMHTTDWLPTLLSMAGGGSIALPADTDGHDHWDAIRNGAASTREDLVYTAYYLDVNYPPCGGFYPWVALQRISLWMAA